MIENKSDWMEHADYKNTGDDGQHWIRLWTPWNGRLRNLNFMPQDDIGDEQTRNIERSSIPEPFKLQLGSRQRQVLGENYFQQLVLFIGAARSTGTSQHDIHIAIWAQGGYRF